VLHGGKTQKNGKVAYNGAIRHMMPELCPHGALARWLCVRFTIGGEAFPMPGEPAWLATAMWPAHDPRHNITYDAQAKAVKAYLLERNIFISKVTHAFRIYGARVLDEAGISDQVCGATAALGMC
jgi:hypothetical protein